MSKPTPETGSPALVPLASGSPSLSAHKNKPLSATTPAFVPTAHPSVDSIPALGGAASTSSSKPSTTETSLVNGGGASATTTSSSSSSSSTSFGTHPLEYKWTMWYTNSSADSWEPRQIGHVSTVEEFWCLYNNLLPPSRIPIGSNFHMFKYGVDPTWEDEANSKGGKWSIELSKHEDRLMDELWMWTLMAVIGEYFENSSLINGVIVSPRPKGRRLAIWTTNTEEQAMKKLGAEWRAALNLEVDFTFQSHADAQTSKKSIMYKNPT